MQAGCEGRHTSSEHVGAEEHEHPAHMPPSFVAAISEVKQRISALKKAKAVDHQAQSQELRDIVRWLPELAGDTDLRKSDWDAVNESSKKMEVLLAPLLDGTDDRSASSSEMEKVVDSLQSLASKSQSNDEAVWKP